MQIIETRNGSYVNAALIEVYDIYSIHEHHYVQARAHSDSDEQSIYDIARFDTKEQARVALDDIAVKLAFSDDIIIRGIALENEAKERKNNESDTV